MEFNVFDLEREAIDFDLELAPGAVDLGGMVEQQGLLAVSGRAELLHENRGPKDIGAASPVISRRLAPAALSRSSFRSKAIST